MQLETTKQHKTPYKAAHRETSDGLDEQTRRLVTAAISRFLARTRAKYPTQTNRLSRFLALSASVGALRGGARAAAPAPELAAKKWPTAAWALRSLGMTQRELVAAYEVLEAREGPLASFDEEFVDRFVLRELWPIVALLAEEGPVTAGQRAEDALRIHATAALPATKVRVAGPPAQSGINDIRNVGRGLFGVLCELQRRGHPDPRLAAWDTLPVIRSPRVGRESWEVSAPPLRKLRQAYAELDGRIRDALRLRPHDDVLDAIEAATPTRLIQRGSIFRDLRDLLVFAVLVVTASRPEAVAELMRSDFVADHRGVEPDRRGGYALRLRPGKHLPPTEVRVKVLPRELGRLIEAYLLYLEKVVPYLGRWRRYGLRRGYSGVVPEDFPLLVSDRVNFRHFGADGIRRLVSGVPPDVRSRSRPPLIVRERGFNPELTAEERRYVGYRPSELRHAGFKLAERGGQLWNTEHDTGGPDPVPEPKLYAHALTDHKNAEDALRARYGDHNARVHYELLAGRAIENIWRLLTGEEGLRRRPNVERVDELAREVQALEGHLQHVERSAAARYGDPGPALPPKLVRPPLPGDASEAEKTSRLVAATDKLLERQDLMFDQVAELRAHLTAMLAGGEQARAVRRRIRELTVEMSSLAYDGRRWISIPDSEPDGADKIAVDLGALIDGRELLAAGADEGPPAPPKRKRDWLLLTELAELCEIANRSTVARWARGEHLPSVPAHRPWEAGAIPVDSSLGANYRRAWVDGINDSFWPTPTARALRDEYLARWPARKKGWGTPEKPGPRCFAALVLPEPFATAHAKAHSQDGSEDGNGD
jgi:hypothetical protein